MRGLRGGEWLFLIPAVATIGLAFLEGPLVVGAAVFLVAFTGLAGLALQDRMGKHQKTTGPTGLQVAQSPIHFLRTSNVELTEGQKLAQQYAERFGHEVPMLALVGTPPDEVMEKARQALATGKPVPGWDKMPICDFEPKTPELVAEYERSKKPSMDDDPEEVRGFQIHQGTQKAQGRPR